MIITRQSSMLQLRTRYRYRFWLSRYRKLAPRKNSVTAYAPALPPQQEAFLWQACWGWQRSSTGKSNSFPILDILEYLKNTHKNPKFGKVRQVPTREFPTKFPGWDLSHSSKFAIFMGTRFFKYPKISKNGNLLFFSVKESQSESTQHKFLNK